jgi:hypothetical protein
VTVGVVAVVVLGLLAFWVIGGIVLRLAGAALALLALVGLAVSSGHGAGAGVPLFLVGVVLWLAGHWHFALRHHAYKSPLAQRVFLQLLPRRLDPTRNWGIPTNYVESRERGRPPRP